MQGLQGRIGVSSYIKQEGIVVWGIGLVQSFDLGIYKIHSFFPFHLYSDLYIPAVYVFVFFVFVFLRAVLGLQRFLLVSSLEVTQIILKELARVTAALPRRLDVHPGDEFWSQP